MDRQRSSGMGLATLVAGLAMSTGCTPEPRSPSTSASFVRDSAGVRVVESAEALWDHPWTIDDAAVVSIGDASGLPGHDLYQVRSAVKRADGTLVIANLGTSELRWYSDAGELVGSAGGEGEGPGEFARLWDVFRLGGDTVAAIDQRVRRISIFDGARAFVRSVSLPRDLGGLPTARFHDGTYFATGGGGLSRGVGPSPIRRVPITVHRLHEAPDAPELLATLEGVELLILPDDRTRSGRVSTVRPFSARPYVAAGAHGWVVGNSQRAEIEYRAPTGALEVVARWAVGRRAVTADDVRADIDRRVASRDDPRGRAQIRRRWASAPPPPDSMPVFDRLFIDDERHVWIREYWPPAEESPNRFHVLSPEGRWLGSVRAPAGLSLLSIGSDHVVAVRTDELGVEVVSVHRLDKPTR